MKLKFYEVDSEYIEFLRKNGDGKIPNIAYERFFKRRGKVPKSIEKRITLL